MYVYHRFNREDRIFPKKTAKQNAIKPVLQVPRECLLAVFEKLSERYHLLPQMEKTAEIVPLPPKKAISEFHQQAASSSFAAPEPAYINDDRFFKKKKTESQQEGHSTTVEQKEETPAWMIWRLMLIINCNHKNQNMHC